MMAALRKEHEVKFIHWLRAMGVFIVLRGLTIIFQSLVNVSPDSSNTNPLKMKKRMSVVFKPN